ncbi:MAG: citrate lyase subunit beta / citryl-CoA lyase [Thermovirga sp.]|jgi:citrate lyase subunit beta/citryl-CoA lyase|nr:citrate lyase subunit beta / citryl-CoA lyase [Thermovirga sp.]MDN5368056.1 citrate lyase subunit beta / citryl-CoA lyase [Thermovirga sp.]
MKGARIYRSALYIPGNNPGMIQHCPYFGADSVILDLEDAVATTEKDAARKLVSLFLEALDFSDTGVVVRVNGAHTPYFEKDLWAVVPKAPDALRIPKCESPQDIKAADDMITEIEIQCGIPKGKVKIHAMIESALGVERAYEIAQASPRVEALTLGGQDLLADYGVQKTKEGHELFYPRTRVVSAAKAAGLLAFDTVWTDISDLEGLKKESKMICELGFTGKAAIHPSQVPIIHDAFKPDCKEVQKARRIVESSKRALSLGIGVFSVDGRMVDAPVIKRAEHLLKLAELYPEFRSNESQGGRCDRV